MLRMRCGGGYARPKGAARPASRTLRTHRPLFFVGGYRSN